MPISGRAPDIDELGSAIEMGVQSFCILLTPLTYIPLGNIDIETCSKCGGAIKVIACIEYPLVIDKILTHLDKKAALAEPLVLQQSRAPPLTNLFD